MSHLWLIGMMGSGKTTVGKQVAEIMGLPHLDVDQIIESRTKRTVSQIFAAPGEAVFRQWERAEIIEIADQSQAAVISTGGGAVLEDANLEMMRSSGVVVWLDAPLWVLAERIDGGRPLLEVESPTLALENLLRERRHRYETAAHYVVNADRSISEIATELSEFARIGIGSSCEILIGPDFPSQILPHRENRRRVVVLAQPSVLPLANRVVENLTAQGEEVPARIQIPDRDEAKTVETAGSIYLRLAELNLGRGDTIVGVGGGAATDLAGFVAATWLRGVESILVPTTLLGAVDAAIGGKTGVNVAGKNLVGAFWHPRRVVISLRVLQDLPRHLLQEGAAEAFKAGLIADPRLAFLYQAYGSTAPLGEVVRRAISVKAEVVRGDFRESGHRAILNFGHTIGHGLETVCQLPHGHAVAVGMVAEAVISARRYRFDPNLVIEPLRKIGLPVQVEDAPRDQVLTYMARDKKRLGASTRMVLLRGVADPVVETVTPAEVDVGLASVGVV